MWNNSGSPERKQIKMKHLVAMGFEEPKGLQSDSPTVNDGALFIAISEKGQELLQFEAL